LLTLPLLDTMTVETVQPHPQLRLATMRVLEARLLFPLHLATQHPWVVQEVVLQLFQPRGQGWAQHMKEVRKLVSEVPRQVAMMQLLQPHGQGMLPGD